jgi:predicted RNA binding protein YcfA (HicA-like mRNA interferase family)
MGLGDLPVASALAHVKAFQRAGFVLQKRRGRGSHYLLKKPGVRMIISIPDHREVKRTLLARQIANAGLTEAQYLRHFNDE